MVRSRSIPLYRVSVASNLADFPLLGYFRLCYRSSNASISQSNKNGNLPNLHFVKV
jgi:hypothetical protein